MITDELVTDITDAIEHLMGDLKAGDLEQFRDDLAQVHAWGTGRYRALGSGPVPPEAAYAVATRRGEQRRALTLRLSAATAVAQESREILQRFLADCERLEVLAATEVRAQATRSRPAVHEAPWETKAGPTQGRAVRPGCPPNCPHCED